MAILVCQREARKGGEERNILLIIYSVFAREEGDFVPEYPGENRGSG